MDKTDGEVKEQGGVHAGECVEVTTFEAGGGNSAQGSGSPSDSEGPLPATVQDGIQGSDILAYRDYTVGVTNRKKAEHWLDLGKMLDDARRTAHEKYGYEGDFFALMAEDESCLYAVTELRNFYRCYLLWTGQLSGKTDRLKKLSLSHLIQVLPKKYTTEDREVHLFHAADQGLRVSAFKDYLKQQETHIQDILQGGPVAGTTTNTKATTTDCTVDQAKLLTALNRVFEQLVGLTNRPGAKEIPNAIRTPLLHIVRFAVTHGVVSREEVVRFPDAGTSEATDADGDADPGNGSHGVSVAESAHPPTQDNGDTKPGVVRLAIAGIPLTFLDAFSGLSAFGVAAETFGMRCAYAVDLDWDCRAVHLANTGILPAGDITAIDAKDIPSFNWLFAGFPCPPWSINGRHGGFGDPRGQLIHDVIRILDHHRPACLLLENVPALLKHNGGRSFRIIADELERIGYRLHHAVLNPSDYGIPVARKRLYIVGFRRDICSGGFAFPESDHRPSDISGLLLPDEETAHFVVTERPDIVLLPGADNPPMELRGRQPIRVGHIRGGRHTGDVIYSPYGHACTFVAAGGKTGLYLVNGSVRRLHPRECARIMGFPESYRIMGCDSVALRQFGNTAVVTLLRMIMAGMLKTLGIGEGSTRLVA